MNPAGTRIHKDACVMPCMPKEEREELNKSNVVEELGHGAFAWSSVALFFYVFQRDCGQRNRRNALHREHALVLNSERPSAEHAYFTFV